MLRHTGWVKKRKVAEGEKLRLIIITGSSDDRISYAMFASQGISSCTYRVRFDLVKEKTV